MKPEHQISTQMHFSDRCNNLLTSIVITRCWPSTAYVDYCVFCAESNTPHRGYIRDPSLGSIAGRAAQCFVAVILATSGTQ